MLTMAAHLQTSVTSQHVSSEMSHIDSYVRLWFQPNAFNVTLGSRHTTFPGDLASLSTKATFTALGQREVAKEKRVEGTEGATDLKIQLAPSLPSSTGIPLGSPRCCSLPKILLTKATVLGQKYPYTPTLIGLHENCKTQPRAYDNSVEFSEADLKS